MDMANYAAVDFRRRDFLSLAGVATLSGALSWRAFAQAPVTLADSRGGRVQQHRKIEVSGATLECTIYGSGIPVVLLANAGCSTGYFEDLARVLAAGGLQAISINMRGVGESRGSLDGTTLHDLAADVAGVLEAMDCGPVH